MDRAIGNKVINFEKCEGDYSDVYPLIGAVLQKELDRVLGGSVSKDIHQKTKKDARKYANDFCVWIYYAGDYRFSK